MFKVSVPIITPPTGPRKFGLAPLLCENPRILILGSLPGDESIRRQEYYGNTRNFFWEVLAGVFGDRVPGSYPEKKALLAKYHIVLWDVCCSAIREGSRDANIREPLPNDIAALLGQHPSIRTVVLNGGKAARDFRHFRIGDSPAFKGVKVFRLTSTSPTSRSAGWPPERITAQWRAVLNEL